jgi:hypothetical protein
VGKNVLRNTVRTGLATIKIDRCLNIESVFVRERINSLASTFSTRTRMKRSIVAPMHSWGDSKLTPSRSIVSDPAMASKERRYEHRLGSADCPKFPHVQFPQRPMSRTFLFQYALTVFEDTRRTVLNSVSNRLALTTSVASLKSGAIRRAHVVQQFDRSQCVPELSTNGVN